jgi:hypothetical protein
VPADGGVVALADGGVVALAGERVVFAGVAKVARWWRCP